MLIECVIADVCASPHHRQTELCEYSRWTLVRFYPTVCHKFTGKVLSNSLEQNRTSVGARSYTARVADILAHFTVRLRCVICSNFLTVHMYGYWLFWVVIGGITFSTGNRERHWILRSKNMIIRPHLQSWQLFWTIIVLLGSLQTYSIALSAFEWIVIMAVGTVWAAAAHRCPLEVYVEN